VINLCNADKSAVWSAPGGGRILADIGQIASDRRGPPPPGKLPVTVLPSYSAAMSIEFLITSLIVVVAPGTGVLYTLATGLSRGSRASVIAAFGCTLGILPHMTAAIMGVAALLHTSALAFQTFKYLGVAYLLYLAWNALKERGALSVDKEINARSAIQVTVTGILINILNPKLSIFFLAFLPQFVSAEEAHPFWHMAELSAVFMAMTFVIFVGYGLFAAAVRNHVISRPRVMAWMRRSFAAAFLALGVKLAFTDR
jgi:threonine/homoserine/homoserine lactone efflux protein